MGVKRGHGVFRGVPEKERRGGEVRGRWGGDNQRGSSGLGSSSSLGSGLFPLRLGRLLLLVVGWSLGRRLGVKNPEVFLGLGLVCTLRRHRPRRLQLEPPLLGEIVRHPLHLLHHVVPMRVVPERNLKLWKARELFLGLNRSPRHGGLLQARVLARLPLPLHRLHGLHGLPGGILLLAPLTAPRPVRVLLVLPGGGANLGHLLVFVVERDFRGTKRRGLVGGSGGRHRRHDARTHRSALPLSPLLRPAPRVLLKTTATHRRGRLRCDRARERKDLGSCHLYMYDQIASKRYPATKQQRSCYS